MRVRRGFAVGLAAMACALVAAPSLAQEDDWGFDEEEEVAPATSPKPEPEPEPVVDPIWDLTGDVSLGSSYNYLSHSSATGTHYGNLARLRAQLDLQLDVDLFADWEARVEGYGFYDFAYITKGRSRYTDDVIDDYEWEVDFREVWLQGSVLPSLDLKLGRQIVNWGRSDTLRVLDVINPLDNREPGLVDIEDLRLPVTMARVDYYPGWIPDEYGAWSLQFLVIPEFRQNRNPSVGNDFNPAPELPPGVAELPSKKKDRFFADPEFGGHITGTFSGWDVSVYGARIYTNQNLVTFSMAPPAIRVRFARVTMVGAGGNLTLGSWLLKGELAWLDGIEYATGSLQRGVGVAEKSRLDAMGGVEYYGINDLTLALEVAHRHILDFDDDMNFEFMGMTLAYAEEDVTEGALRVTADFLNTRLRVTGVAFVFLAADDHLGSVVRAEVSYELMEALQLGGGIVLYQEGDSPGFDTVGKNDRLFLRLEYSF